MTTVRIFEALNKHSPSKQNEKVHKTSCYFTFYSDIQLENEFLQE